MMPPISLLQRVNHRRTSVCRLCFSPQNYYLTDVTEAKYGGTEVIPGTHLLGTGPPPEIEGTEWESKIRYNSGESWKRRYVQQSGMASWGT